MVFALLILLYLNDCFQSDVNFFQCIPRLLLLTWLCPHYGIFFTIFTFLFSANLTAFSVILIPKTHFCPQMHILYMSSEFIRKYTNTMLSHFYIRKRMRNTSFYILSLKKRLYKLLLTEISTQRVSYCDLRNIIMF